MNKSASLSATYSEDKHSREYLPDTAAELRMLSSELVSFVDQSIASAYTRDLTFILSLSANTCPHKAIVEKTRGS